MASVLMAWVLIGVSLAQLNNAESHLYKHDLLTGQDEFYDGNEWLSDAARDQRFFAPVWKFVQGEIHN